MGTPEFAVTILEELVLNEYNIKAVVTVPDKPAGRGRKLKGSAVKSCAVAHQLPVLQPTHLKDEEFVGALQALQADLFIVVAFRMLPKVVWKIPSMGTFNLHGSLLPAYRGAAPINWAVINGETKTGVTTFFIDEKIDTGEIILAREMEIGAEENAGELHDRMMVLGAKTVVETVELIRKGEAKGSPQPEYDLKPAPKIQKQDCLINFDQSLTKVHNFIRGMSPYPTAWMKIENIHTQEQKTMKIFQASIFNEQKHDKVTLLIEDKMLLLKTFYGTMHLKEVQLEGKKRLPASTFISGFKPEDWSVII